MKRKYVKPVVFFESHKLADNMKKKDFVTDEHILVSTDVTTSREVFLLGHNKCLTQGKF